MREPLFDLTATDTSRLAFTPEDIRAINPHRFEFEMLDGILSYSDDPLGAVGWKKIEGDDWWCRGHLPGQPIFPGVLMIESAAQASSFCYHKRFGKLDGKFFGFGGLEKVRFRGAVGPGDDLLVVVRENVVRHRRAIFDVQGWVGEKCVCEAQVIGVTVPYENGASGAAAD